MANRIKLKRSTVPGRIPNPTDLEVGEIAINTADAVIYTKHSDNTIVTISGGTTNVTAGNTNIYNGRTTVDTNVTLVDSFSATGATSVRWTLSSYDAVNDKYKTSTVDSTNNGSSVFYNEYGIVLSDSSVEVATFTANITGGNITLYALGESANVAVTYQRTVLGSSTLEGYVSGVSYVQSVVGSGTATNCVVDSFTGTGSQTAFTLSTSPDNENQTLVSVGGILQPKSTYSLSGTTLTFSSAPDNGVGIEVISFVTTTVTGYTGSAGANGTNGYTGSQGIVGYTGSRGDDGTIGYNGSTGYTGSAGTQGSTGYTGSQGLTPIVESVSAPTDTSLLWVDPNETGPAGFDGNVAGNLYVAGTTFVSGNIIPTSNNTINIGSPTARFGTIYVSANTIDIGGATISATESGDLEFGTSFGTVPITSNTVNFLNTVSTTSIGQGDLSALAPSRPIINYVFVTTNTYTVLDDTAVDVAGGYIKLTGSGFVDGCTVLIGNTPATSTTFINSTEVRAQVPAMSAGTYIVFLINGNGQTAIKVNGITFSGFPAWVTGSALAAITSGKTANIQLSANGAVSYSLAVGSTLPTGLTLAGNGRITGSTTVANNTSFTFTVNADDAENQTSPRTFTLPVSVQVVLQYTVGWSDYGVGKGAWDYGRTPSGIIFNTIDKNGVSMATALWPTAPSTVRITYIGTTTNLDIMFPYTSVILPGQSGGFAGVTNDAYQILKNTGVTDPFASVNPYYNALQGEAIVATVYLLPAQ